MKKVLIIAYYFPPMGGGGVQRILKFVKYLPQNGWQPIVLTINPEFYFGLDQMLCKEIPEEAIVYRTKSWDPLMLFSKLRRKPSADARPKKAISENRRKLWDKLNNWIFLPDSKIPWYYTVNKTAKEIIKKHKPDIIFSSAPPNTGHLISAKLKKLYGVPVVMDFRDHWAENPLLIYQPKMHKFINRQLEKRTVRNADCLTFINDEIKKSYEDKYSLSNCIKLNQGYDPEDFESVKGEKQDKFTITYTGTFYQGRKPDYMFAALKQLFREKPGLKDKIVFNMVGDIKAEHVSMVESFGLGENVKFSGYLPHNESVQHLMSADVLWLMIRKGKNANMIATGKLFEYIATGKPILASIPPEGSAARILREYKNAIIIDSDDIDGIKNAIISFYHNTFNQPADMNYVAGFDREKITGQLADLFNGIINTSY